MVSQGYNYPLLPAETAIFPDGMAVIPAGMAAIPKGKVRFPTEVSNCGKELYCFRPES